MLFNILCMKIRKSITNFISIVVELKRIWNLIVLEKT